MTRETCAVCGFDGDEYTRGDLLGTLRAIAPIWRTMTEGLSPSTATTRPAGGAHSATEHAVHSRDLLQSTADALDCAPPSPAAVEAPSLAEAVSELEARVGAVIAKVNGFDDSDWARCTASIEHTVHDTTHRLRDVGRGLHALGAGAPQQRGALVQINASKGGVPKSALPSAKIGPRGVIGDEQGERRHHGRPLQALSLWSQEVIDALRAEGHPVYPGAAGENLTVSGIDWATIRPGVRISVGGALTEISAFATPCTKNAQWFVDGNFRRMEHTLYPGWSRAYAWVVEGGSVEPGDPVVVEP